MSEERRFKCFSGLSKVTKVTLPSTTECYVFFHTNSEIILSKNYLHSVVHCFLCKFAIENSCWLSIFF